jgi:catechol 2,3-dioxygenase-like lactoylglutathione lyase family enzyme
MQTQISLMLAVSDGSAAIDFYKAAFGAKLLWHLGDGHVVAGLSIDGARFFLAHESPPHGTRGPRSVGFTTVRIEPLRDRSDRGTQAGAGGRRYSAEPGGNAHT